MILSPAYGSYMYAKNWEALGNEKEKGQSTVWMYISIAVIAAAVLFADKYSGAVVFWLLVIWWFSSGKKHFNFVKNDLGGKYQSKSVLKPSIISAIAVFVSAIGLTLIAESVNGSGSSLPAEVSGVWKEHGGNALVVLQGSENEMKMAIFGNVVPVSLGEVDEEHGTINLNAVDQRGNPMVWTLRQVWNQDHTGYHLSITMQDGSQSDLEFIRKPTDSDLAVFSEVSAAEPPAQSAPVKEDPSPAPAAGISGTYEKDNGVVEVSEGAGEIQFSINSSEGDQSCELEGVAAVIDQSRAAYTSEDPDNACSAVLNFGGGQLTVTVNGCESSCGMNAIGTMAGSYQKK